MTAYGDEIEISSRTQSKRPLRESFEEQLDNIPEGPFGKTGEGDVFGVAGFFAVETARTFTGFIPGLKQPGYHIVGHSISEHSEYMEHTLVVSAISRDVAEFVAQYTAAPSNIDFVASDIERMNVKKVKERETYSHWEITVRVYDAGKLR